MALERVVNARMREADAVTVELAAEVAGVSVSEFVREAVLDEAQDTLRAAGRQSDRTELLQERRRG